MAHAPARCQFGLRRQTMWQQRPTRSSLRLRWIGRVVRASHRGQTTTLGLVVRWIPTTSRDCNPLHRMFILPEGYTAFWRGEGTQLSPAPRGTGEPILVKTATSINTVSQLAIRLVVIWLFYWSVTWGGPAGGPAPGLVRACVRLQSPPQNAAGRPWALCGRERNHGMRGVHPAPGAAWMTSIE